MRHVDLCSGIGGFALGFQWAGLSPQPHLFCDIEPWCRSILQQHWPNVPVASDVKELANDPDRNVPDCDIITAGYPCQPFSAAGKRKGTEDDRHIWPYILKIVASKRPTWCVFENVYGHISLGLDEVLTDLEHEGYTTRTFVVPACGVNAPHKRNRVWIIAHTNNPRQPTDEGESRTSKEGNNTGRLCENVSNTSSSRQQGHHWGRSEQFTQDTCKDVPDTNSKRRCGGNTKRKDAEDAWESSSGKRYYERGVGIWDFEPNVGRVANGIPKRVDRIKGLGNAIVPQIAERIAWTILEISK